MGKAAPADFVQERAAAVAARVLNFIVPAHGVRLLPFESTCNLHSIFRLHMPFRLHSLLVLQRRRQVLLLLLELNLNCVPD